MSVHEQSSGSAHTGVRSADDDDRYISRRIAYWRQVRGWSQGRLGNALGVTFQQIQKYEQGVNRVGAGRLVKIARALDVPLLELVPACPDAPTNADTPQFDAEALCVAQLWSAIRDVRARRAARRLIRDLSAADEG